MDKHIGEKIRQFRAISGLSQEYVADEIGMSHGNYGKIERGDIDVSSTRLIQIAKVLKTNVSDFFEEGPRENIKESKGEYGYITKHEFDFKLSELSHALLKITKVVERIEQQFPSSKSLPKKAPAKKPAKKK